MSLSIVGRIVALGSELNANQYKLVCLAAEYDSGLEWFRQGHANPAIAIAHLLGVHSSIAREWIRVGHTLDDLPCIDQAFRENHLSYAKARILTRWADPGNEADLLAIAEDRTASRLTVAVAKFVAGDESDGERDQRHHDNRGVTIDTDAEGMVVIRATLPPDVGKQVAEAINTVVQKVAATPADEPVETSELCSASAVPAVSEPSDPSADAFCSQPVTRSNAVGGQNPSADGSAGPSMRDQLRGLKTRWQPVDGDGSWIPSLAQQRADALVLLFLGKNIDLVTEVVIHVRGDGATFDGGTLVTSSAVCRRLDESFIRVMVHDAVRRPVDVSNRRRYPTTRQKRVVMAAHNHECLDCQSTDLLELDHNPPYHQTRHTVTTELEPRCAPCHRARH